MSHHPNFFIALSDLLRWKSGRSLSWFHFISKLTSSAINTCFTFFVKIFSKTAAMFRELVFDYRIFTYICSKCDVNRGLIKF